MATPEKIATISAVAEAAEVLILAPLAGDGQSIRSTLQNCGIPSRACDSPEDLEARLNGELSPALCVVLSHEGSGSRTGRILLEMRERQPDWSAPPVVILAASAESHLPVYEILVEAQSSPPPLILARPVPPRQFVAAVQTQVSARRRQFEIGALLAELSASEQRQQFLLQELRHRTRNSLSVIRGMFSISARTADSVEALAAEFEPRLRAMATAHTALSEEASETLPLDRIVSMHVAPYLPLQSQIEISGPEIQLEHSASIDFAMVVHELATNAAKYGALSVVSGKVGVSWHIGENGNLFIEWRESDGPLVEPPDHEGLGTSIIRATRIGGVEGAHLRFREQGLVWQVEVESGFFTLAQTRGDERHGLR